jgi:hypothetical protein
MSHTIMSHTIMSHTIMSHTIMSHTIMSHTIMSHTYIRPGPERPNFFVFRGIEVVRTRIKMFAQKKVTLPQGFPLQIETNHHVI